MSRREVDFDNADDVARVWAEMQLRHAAREAAPELHAAIARKVDEALAEGRLSEARAAEIRADLDRAHPRAVLLGFYRELVPDRPALGAFPRAHREPVDLDAWYREDPLRLAAIVVEMRRFTSDLPRIVEAVLDIADRAGVPADVADSVVTDALRPQGGRRVS